MNRKKEQHEIICEDCGIYANMYESSKHSGKWLCKNCHYKYLGISNR